MTDRAPEDAFVDPPGPPSEQERVRTAERGVEEAVEQLLDAPSVTDGEFHGGRIAAHRAEVLLGGTI